MNSVFTIELFEEHQNVSFYTICFEEESSEFDKFLDKYPPGGAYDNDVNIIITWLDKIGESGALERYFRPEGRLKDDVCAIRIDRIIKHKMKSGLVQVKRKHLTGELKFDI